MPAGAWRVETGVTVETGEREPRRASLDRRLSTSRAQPTRRGQKLQIRYLLLYHMCNVLPRERRVTRVADPLPTRLETRVVARAVVSHCNAITQLILQPLPHPSPQPPPPHPIPPLPHVLVRVSARAELRGCCANAIGVPSACPRCATSQLLLCCYEKVECCATAFIKPSCHLS